MLCLSVLPSILEHLFENHRWVTASAKYLLLIKSTSAAGCYHWPCYFLMTIYKDFQALWIAVACYFWKPQASWIDLLLTKQAIHSRCYSKAGVVAQQSSTGVKMMLYKLRMDFAGGHLWWVPAAVLVGGHHRWRVFRCIISIQPSLSFGAFLFGSGDLGWGFGGSAAVRGVFGAGSGFRAGWGTAGGFGFYFGAWALFYHSMGFSHFLDISLSRLAARETTCI